MKTCDTDCEKELASAHMHSLWLAGEEGDADAKKRFLLNLRRGLERWVGGRCGPTMAEEVIAEAWPTIYFELREYDPARGSIWPWAYTHAAEALRMVGLAQPQVYRSKHVYQQERASGNDMHSVSLDSIDGDQEFFDHVGGLHPDVDSRGSDPAMDVERRDTCEHVLKLLDELTPHQRRLVSAYFGLNGTAQRSVNQLSCELGVSRQAVDGCIKYAMAKLKDRAVKEKLAF